MSNWNISETSGNGSLRELVANTSQTGGGAAAVAVGLLFTKTSVIIKFTIAMAMFLVGTTGNGFMVYVIWKSPHLRSNTNILMVWLIIADILVGFTGALYIGIYQLVAFVISGNPCRFIGIVASAFVFPILPNMAAVAILVVIAVDRYIAIVHPFQYAILVTDQRINLAIVACWAYGLFFGVVHAVYLYRVDFSSCAPPYSMVMESVIDNSNYIAITLLMIFMYGRIFKVAMDQRNKIEATSTSANQQERVATFKKEMKAVRVTAMILGTFVILWFPFQFGRFLQAIGNTQTYTQYLVDVGLSLGAFNHAIDWLIYCVSCQEFRHAIIKTMVLTGRK